MAQINSIIFDLDGTLIDSHPGIEIAIKAALDEILPGVEHNFSRNLIGPPIRKILQNALDNPSAEILELLIAKYREIYDHSSCIDFSPYHGVVETLNKIRTEGIKCFIVTNKPKLPTKKIIDFLGLNETFLDLVSPDSIAPSFGSKIASTKYLIGRNKIDINSTIFVGDSDDDAEASLQSNISKFVAVEYGYGKAYKTAKFKIKKFGDLLEII